MVAAVVIALGIWVLKPLFGAGVSGEEEVGANPEIEDLMEAKGSVYRTIVDLEMDYKMGKLDRGDYERLRTQSKVEALDLIRRIEGARDPETDEATLEQEIAQARARLQRQ